MSLGFVMFLLFLFVCGVVVWDYSQDWESIFNDLYLEEEES